MENKKTFYPEITEEHVEKLRNQISKWPGVSEVETTKEENDYFISYIKDDVENKFKCIIFEEEITLQLWQ